jgi:hypothetical protein
MRTRRIAIQQTQNARARSAVDPFRGPVSGSTLRVTPARLGTLDRLSINLTTLSVDPEIAFEKLLSWRRAAPGC